MIKLVSNVTEHFFCVTVLLNNFISEIEHMFKSFTAHAMPGDVKTKFIKYINNCFLKV